MRLTILKSFHDKFSFSTIYQVGQVVEFDEERADLLLQLGLATPTEKKQDVIKETTIEEVVEKTPDTPVEQPTVAEAPQQEPSGELFAEETPKRKRNPRK